MKKTLTMIVLFLATLCASAQEPFELSEVIQAEGRTADQIYETLQRWVASSWKFPEAVKKYEASGKEIMISGRFKYACKGFALMAYHGSVSYTLEIQIREGRFKVTMSGLNNDRVFSKVQPLGVIFARDLTKDEYKNVGMSKMSITYSGYNKATETVRQEAKEEFTKMISHIKLGLENQKVKEEEDW